MEDKINKERKAKIWRETKIRGRKTEIKRIIKKKKRKRIPERRGRRV